MEHIHPLYALVTFTVIAAILFFVLRPEKGIYWLMRRNNISRKKIILEDILKFLYHSETTHNSINIKDLTRSLDFSDHQIIESTRQMTEHGLIRLEGDCIKLTREGNGYALQIVRAHRLWEHFLAEKTGFDKTQWHNKAELMEHELSREDTDKLAAALGHPMFDPHGDPIPTKSGKIASRKTIALSLLEPGSIGRIVHIEDEPEVIYRQILAENIHIGSQIKVIENTPSRLIFHAEGESFTLAPIVAANLSIAVLDKDEIPEDGLVRLSTLKPDERAEIAYISKEIRGERRRRLLDLGFVKGAKVEIDLPNPLGEPKAFRIKGTSIALRNNQSSKILIKKADSWNPK